MRAPFVLAAGWLALAAAAAPPASVARVDPLTVEDDDFARHRDPPPNGRGSPSSGSSSRTSARRGASGGSRTPRHRHGPLWFVPHDNENGGFEAAFAALRKYGGTAIVVDSGHRAGP
ncbi:MAG: hypothetical protein WDN44_10380 [Sphingomonas sp.]